MPDTTFQLNVDALNRIAGDLGQDTDAPVADGTAAARSLVGLLKAIVQRALAVAASVAAVGTVTAPAAGAAIVSIASGSLPAGRYLVQALCGYGGTASTINNMQLRRGATVITGLYVLAVANGQPPWLEFYVELDGTESLSVNAIALGAAGTIFDAMLVATKLR